MAFTAGDAEALRFAGANSTFGGSVDVGTLTLNGSAIIADVGMTLQVDGGTTNSITMGNAGTVTFGYYTYFPNYLFHEGDTDTYIRFLTDRILFSHYPQ